MDQSIQERLQDGAKIEDFKYLSKGKIFDEKEKEKKMRKRERKSNQEKNMSMCKNKIK
jgi:hypothetical protein